MKAALSCSVILALCVVALGVNSFLLSRGLRRCADAVERTALLDADAVRSVYDDFGKSERFYALTVNHTDLTNLESAFAEWYGAAIAEDDKNAQIIKSRLTDAIQHLKRQVGFSADGIL